MNSTRRSPIPAPPFYAPSASEAKAMRASLDRLANCLAWAEGARAECIAATIAIAERQLGIAPPSNGADRS